MPIVAINYRSPEGSNIVRVMHGWTPYISFPITFDSVLDTASVWTMAIHSISPSVSCVSKVGRSTPLDQFIALSTCSQNPFVVDLFSS